MFEHRYRAEHAETTWRKHRMRFSVVLVLVLHHIAGASCFVLPLNKPPLRQSSLTVVFGVRAKLRRKLSAFKWSSSHHPTSKKPSSHTETKTEATSPSSSTQSEPALSSSTQPAPSSSTSTTTTTTKLAVTHQNFAPNERLYEMPPINRNLTKLEREFRDMLEHFHSYTQRDILSLRDPRMRTLFEGVAASVDEPPVYRAFEVLYEDLYPFRMAGRIIFKRLQKLMNDSLRERREEVDQVVAATGLAPVDVEEARLVFVTTAAELNGDAFLTNRQLARSGLADVATDVLGYDSAETLLQILDKEQSGKLSFVHMMTGLEQCAEEMCGIEKCNPAVVMQELMTELKDHPPEVDHRLDEKRQRFSDRYDHMVTSFCEWRDLVPVGEGRRLDVVKGCFVGAENAKVVNALRIVYVDYSALRIAGDLIFGLVQSVMKGRQRNQRR